MTSPNEFATFHQRHAEVAAILDTHIRANREQLAEGERREVAIAAMICWLRDHAEHEAVAELLAVAIDRLNAAAPAHPEETPVSTEPVGVYDDVPFLVAEVERLRAELEATRVERDDALGQLDDAQCRLADLEADGAA